MVAPLRQPRGGAGWLQWPHDVAFRQPPETAMARLTRSTALAVVLVLAAAPALAQGFDLRSIFGQPGAATGTIAPSTAPTPGAAAAPEWSGESGASGHPAMTAEAIRAAAANFRGCLAELWPLAERRGVSREL